ncbi:hypothetical protein CZ794_03760 [Psychrobacter sp. JB385]|nr:hypothetical protein CZ794_03760 [Psychrobacter sp. JB385]
MIYRVNVTDTMSFSKAILTPSPLVTWCQDFLVWSVFYIILIF